MLTAPFSSATQSASHSASTSASLSRSLVPSASTNQSPKLDPLVVAADAFAYVHHDQWFKQIDQSINKGAGSHGFVDPLENASDGPTWWPLLSGRPDTVY
jgi:hypothetical protein